MARRYLDPVIRALVVSTEKGLLELASGIGLLSTLQTQALGETIKVTHSLEEKEHRFHLRFMDTVEEARQSLRRDHYNVLVVVEPALPGPGLTHTLVESLHLSLKWEGESQPPWRWERTLLVLPQDEKTTDAIFCAGRMRVGGFEKLPLNADRFYAALVHIVGQRSEVGKTAICLAGGGIEGMIFEMGVLRALDIALEGKSVLDFDIYCGISAGAILSSTLANGIPPQDFIRAFKQDSTTIAPIDQSVIFDFDIGEYLGRLGHMISNVGYLRKGLPGLLAMTLRSVPVGFFAGDGIQKHMEGELTRVGRSNDFRRLGKELYVGATDQDTSEHIVFGDEGWDDVPITDAVRASMALVPFYAPKWIRGRWFVDGSFTRTSEVEVAVQKGAKMVIIIDPLVPIRSTVSGYVKAKGGVFGSIQALKSLVHTRFSEGIQRAYENYPDVDFYVFLPEQDDMRLMSGSPLKFNYRMEIERIACLRTLERIQEELPRLTSEWKRHGFLINAQRVDRALSTSGR